MSIRIAFSYTRVLIQTVRWMNRTPKTSYGKSIETMTTAHGQRHVVHGHHHRAHGPIFKKKRTNLDTFAWYTGRLAIAVFDDGTPGGPIDVLEVNGEPIVKILSSSRSKDMPVMLSDVCF